MSSEYNQIQRFPKNLSYNLAVLRNSIIKSKIRIDADRTSYSGNDIIKINLPVGRMIDTRSICLYAKATASIPSGTATSGTIHFPRGGLNSLIENLNITCNGKILQSTSQYNYIWNLLADISGYFSGEQGAKRITENFDPSIAHTNPTGGAIPVVYAANIAVDATSTTNGHDSYYYCVNQWLGFFNGNVSVIDLNNFGTMQISITLAPNNCLFYGYNGTNPASAPTTHTYSLTEVKLCLDTITFTNSVYYDLVKSQLEGGGLNIAYYDYLVQTSSSYSRVDGSTYTHTAQINCSSLDQVIATYRPSNYSTAIDKLVLGTTGATMTLNKLLADPVTNLTGTHRGGFNNSAYFIRDGTGFNFGSWYINSQPFTQQANLIEVINNDLQALNYTNLDISSGSFHPGCLTTGLFATHYFADVLSLENDSGDNNWWVSGLSSQGGVINISYTANFKTSTNSVIPYLIMRCSKVLNVKMGRLLDLME